MRPDATKYQLRRSTRGATIQREDPPAPVGRLTVLTPINPRNDLANHSPDGFEFGYGGSGPAQAALAILADFTGDDQLALQEYQSFKRAFIEPIQGDSAEIRGEAIREWLGARGLP